MRTVAIIAHRTYSDRLGGADRSLLSLIAGLRSRGWQLAVSVSSHGALYHELRHLRVPLAVLKYHNVSGRAVDARNHFGMRALARLSQTRAARRHRNAIPQIAQQLRYWQTSLVYTNSAVVAVGAMVAQHLNLPHIWHVRELVDPAGSLRPYMGWEAYRQLQRKSDACIAISKAVGERLLSHVPPERVYTIYNGILSKHDFGAFRRPTRDHPARLRFLILGGLARAKGQDQAIRAFAVVRRTIPHAVLRIVGGGDRKSLSRLAHDLGVHQAIEFRGPTAHPWEAFEDVDITLVCSEWEPMGRVTVESMAAGIPVIGRATGGTRELIDSGRTGILYDGSDQNLVMNMTRLAGDASQRRRIADRAWRVARCRFSTETYVLAVESVLTSILRNTSQLRSSMCLPAPP